MFTNASSKNTQHAELGVSKLIMVSVCDLCPLLTKAPKAGEFHAAVQQVALQIFHDMGTAGPGSI